MLRRPHGDRTIHEIKNRKVAARRPGGDRNPHGNCSYHKFVARPPYGRREAAATTPWGRRTISRQPRQGKNRMSPHGHRKATVRPPYGDIAVWLRRCGIAVSEKSLMLSLKQTQGFGWLCGQLKTVRSPFGLHEYCKAAKRFGGLKSLYGRRKHAASYMWPWN